MSNQNNIPTPEEFERASRIMREKSRNLDEVCNSVRDRFETLCPLHEFFILDQRDVDFRAYVFFKTNMQLKAAKSSSIKDEIKRFVYSELERLGRGKQGEIKVAFEFDSHENVEANFEGDYYLRLRN